MVKSYFDAEDLAQETFLSAYKSLTAFDGGNEKAWICKIATNKCLDYFRKAGNRVLPTEDTFLMEVKCDTPSPEEYAVEAEVKNQLYHMCNQLKPPYQQVALDYFYYEKEISEMVTESGKNIKTLQTQVYRAKGMLKKLWRKE